MSREGMSREGMSRKQIMKEFVQELWGVEGANGADEIAEKLATL